MSQTRSKTESECTKHPNWPSWAHLSARMAARGRSYRGRVLGRVAGPSGRVVGARSRASAVSQAQCRAPARCVVRLRAVSWPCSALYRNTVPIGQPLSGHDTLLCIATHSLSQASRLQHKRLYCNTVLQQPASSLQYNST